MEKSKSSRVVAQRASIVDIDIPFGSMVGFLVKLAIAAIPASIIISIVYVFLATVLVGVMR